MGGPWGLKNPTITNEEMKGIVLKLVAVVAKLVQTKCRTAGVELLGGEDAVAMFFVSLEVRISRSQSPRNRVTSASVERKE